MSLDLLIVWTVCVSSVTMLNQLKLKEEAEEDLASFTSTLQHFWIKFDII